MTDNTAQDYGHNLARPDAGIPGDVAALAGDGGVRESGVEHVDDTARYSLVVPEGSAR